MLARDRRMLLLYFFSIFINNADIIKVMQGERNV